MTTQTQTIRTYEDNAGGLFMTNGTRTVRISEPCPGCMDGDMASFTSWAYDVHEDDDLSLAGLNFDALTLIGELSPNGNEDRYYDRMGVAGKEYAPPELVEILAGTPIKIDRKKEGQYLIINSAGANAWVDDVPGSYWNWTLEEQSAGLETVQDWLDKGKFKGRCPCVYGPNAIDEGYGPWFTLDTDLIGEVANG